MAMFLNNLSRIEAVMAVAAYAFVACLLFSEIVAREIFTSTIWGSQKMAVFGAIFAGFLGFTLATATNSHLRPRFADNWLPAPWNQTINRIGDVISALVIGGLGIVSVFYLSDTIANSDRVAVLYWPLWPLQIVLPYSFFSSALRHAAFACLPDLKPAADLVDG